MTVNTPEQVEFADEMHDAFRQFGTYANITRGVPDVIDGLKPVHRRILWSMYQTNTHPGRLSKAATVVGDVMGNYHPHGDSAIYSTMAGVAHVSSEGTPFKQPVPLIEGQGGWGDLVDAPAASRYTECSLTNASMALLGHAPNIVGGQAEIKQDTVDLIPNFSGRKEEPEVLPALWPPYVVNGTKGIGVGIANDTPSHNLTEVMNLAIKLVDTPTPRMDTVRSILLGPDLACDAEIYDSDDANRNIESYLVDGRGSFVMRARFEIEEYKISARKTGKKIVVVALPYQVASEHVVAGVSNMVDNADLPVDIEVANYTNAKGIRVVIDIKENDVNDIKQRLLYYGGRSYLQTSVAVNSNAIVEGKIRQIGIIDAIRKWVDHRRTVVRRRSKFRMNKANDRLEIVNGLLKAIPNADKIVEMIRGCDSRSEAEEVLQKPEWGFTARQATAIMDMTLSQLTKLTTDRYLDEKNDLEETIAVCKDLLDNKSSLDNRLKKEMRAVRDEFGYERRCTIVDESPYVAPPETPAVEIPEVKGFLIRTGKNWVRWAKRSSINNVVGNDHVVDKIAVTDGNRMDGISNLGYHYRVYCGDLPEKMTKANALYPAMDPGEELVLADTAAPFGVGTSLALIAESEGENPIIKVIGWDDWASLRAGKNRPVMPIEEGWSLTQAFFLPEKDHDIAIVTAYGNMLRVDPESINAKGRGARGNPVIKLEAENDKIAWAGRVKSSGEEIVYWTSENQVGWFNTNDVSYSSRNTKGQAITKSDNLITGIASGEGNTLNWFGPGMDEAATLDISEAQGGTKLTDNKLTLEAKGVNKANAVWIT